MGPELLRRTPVPGSDGHDHWERWQRLLDRLEAEGVEREGWVCCRQEPLCWRAPLRDDGKAAPVRVPLLPSLDAAGGEVWGRAEMREATRQARYAEAARADGAPGAPVHGSVLLRLASDFLCYKCQKDFVRQHIAPAPHAHEILLALVAEEVGRQAQQHAAVHRGARSPVRPRRS